MIKSDKLDTKVEGCEYLIELLKFETQNWHNSKEGAFYPIKQVFDVIREEEVLRIMLEQDHYKILSFTGELIKTINACEELQNQDLILFSDYVLEKIDDIEFKNISFEVILHILPQLAPSKIKIL